MERDSRRLRDRSSATRSMSLAATAPWSGFSLDPATSFHMSSGSSTTSPGRRGAAFGTADDHPPQQLDVEDPAREKGRRQRRLERARSAKQLGPALCVVHAKPQGKCCRGGKDAADIVADSFPLDASAEQADAGREKDRGGPATENSQEAPDLADRGGEVGVHVPGDVSAIRQGSQQTLADRFGLSRMPGERENLRAVSGSGDQGLQAIGSVVVRSIIDEQQPQFGLCGE